MKNASIKKLHRQIASLLEEELPKNTDVCYQDAMIKIVIPSDDFEAGFGLLLQRIQQSIDKHYPDRATDISLLVRDSGGRFEHVFKIWKTQSVND